MMMMMGGEGDGGEVREDVLEGGGLAERHFCCWWGICGLEVGKIGKRGRGRGALRGGWERLSNLEREMYLHVFAAWFGSSATAGRHVSFFSAC